MKDKKANILQTTLIHIVLIGLIAIIFISSTGQRIDSRYTQQQVVEKQLALFIDSAIPGMEFTILKVKGEIIITNIEILDNKIYATVNGLPSTTGHPIFSQHQINVQNNNFELVITITE